MCHGDNSRIRQAWNNRSEADFSRYFGLVDLRRRTGELQSIGQCATEVCRRPAVRVEEQNAKVEVATRLDRDGSAAVRDQQGGRDAARRNPLRELQIVS